MDYQFSNDKNGNPCLNVTLTDYALITNPLLNKGMAFTEDERREFGLIGLLPPHISNLATQRERSYLAFQSKPSDIEKYLYLRDLQDSNETLFYNLICSHLEELLPIVYTPTVGLGCQRYSHLYRRPRGLYLAYPHQNEISNILANSRFDNTKVIVVSDGERILGLGDQGAGGMGIPIGKLALYTACAGIHPGETLPVLFDTGTNNSELQNDPLYIGWKHERIRGAAYDNFIEAFVQAVKKRFPNVLLQWEDFAQLNATPLLEKYRNQLCTFNDDIQGTAAVAAGTLFAAVKRTRTKLSEQRVVIVGAGSAGCGISNLMMQAMIQDGLSQQEAKTRFYLVDRFGLMFDDMPDLLPFQKQFAQSKAAIESWQCEKNKAISLEDVVRHVRPTVLIGTSGQPGIFTENIIRLMAAHTTHPIIFPLSNPTSRCEAMPEDLINWTEGRAIIGTGSPFKPIFREGQQYQITQTNNCYVFPGLGLGLIAVKAKRVTDSILMIAAKALADCSPHSNDHTRSLLPPLATIREVSLHIASAVAKSAIALGLSDEFQADNHHDIEHKIRQMMWAPDYLPYRFKKL